MTDSSVLAYAAMLRFSLNAEEKLGNRPVKFVVQKTGRELTFSIYGFLWEFLMGL